MGVWNASLSCFGIRICDLRYDSVYIPNRTLCLHSSPKAAQRFGELWALKRYNVVAIIFCHHNQNRRHNANRSLQFTQNDAPKIVRLDKIVRRHNSPKF